MGFAQALQGTEQHPHREGAATGPREPGSAERKVGELPPCVPAGVCWLLRLFLSSVPCRERGPLGC